MQGVWSRWGIRKQLTTVVVLLVAIPLVLGVVLLANLLTNSLAHALVNTSRDELDRVVNYVSDYGPSALPGQLELDSGYRAQVIDSSKDIIWASSTRDYTAAITTARPAPGKVVVEGASYWWGPGDNEAQNLVLAGGASHTALGHTEDYVVIVSTSQADQHSAVTVTTGMLLACVPLVILATALVAWWVGGRALRPVDEMNAQVGRITSSTLDERVPLPVAQDEMRSLAVTMNQMLARLEKAQTSQQRFVSDASHELRSPVASLSGAVEIGRLEDSLETWREMAPLMQDEARRLTQLVQNLLALSRSDDAGLKLHLVEVDVDDLAAEEAARLRGTNGGLEVRTAISAVRVEADPSMVRQVLRNYCDNAARHARSLVRISVLPQPDGGVLLRVEDDGNGVAEADRERVFDRFVRLEESRNRDEGGSGLGLAIVAQIVHAHAGKVRVVGSELGGACFEAYLPAHP